MEKYCQARNKASKMFLTKAGRPKGLPFSTYTAVELSVGS